MKNKITVPPPTLKPLTLKYHELNEDQLKERIKKLEKLNKLVEKEGYTDKVIKLHKELE